MSPLPPELEQLDTQYQQLTDAVEAGHITVASALSALEAMMVVDAYGGIWRIDAEGDFTRADGHGAAPTKIDASHWPTPDGQQHDSAPHAPAPSVAQPLAQPPTVSEPAPGFNPLFNPPAAATAPPSWARNLEQQTPPGANYDTGPTGSGMYASDSGFEAPKSLNKEPETKKASKFKPGKEKSEKEPKARKPNGSTPAFLTTLLARKKVLILAAFGIGLIVLAWWQTRSHETPSQPLPAATATASTGEFTPDGQSTQTDAQAPSSSQPSPEDADRVIAAYQESRTAAAEQTQGASGSELARATFLLSAANSDQVNVQLGQAKKAKQGTYAQPVAIIDTATGAPLFKATLTWANQAGSWTLASVPVFRAP